jgi:seryl-tRNA synthetase
MKNQILEDSIKILERENLLNQEAFEKEKKKIGESFDIVQMENKRLHQQLKEEEEKSSDRIATLMEENQSNIAEIQTKSQDIQDKLAQVESTLLENRKFDERLAALENIFSNLVSSEFTTGYEDLPQADNHSNKEDANKIRIVFEYNERMNK